MKNLLPIVVAVSMGCANLANAQTPGTVSPSSTNPAGTASTGIMAPTLEAQKLVLSDQINAAAGYVNTLQSASGRSIPIAVINQAKGVIILHRSSGLGGWGIGLKKTANGFGNPVFYKLGDASIDAQAGVLPGMNSTDTVAFLMTDKAMKTLTDDQFNWKGNVNAVAGAHSPAGAVTDSSVDIVLYQKVGDLNVATTVLGAELSVDVPSNRVFYGLNVTLTQILNGPAPAAGPARTLIDSFQRPPA